MKSAKLFDLVKFVLDNEYVNRYYLFDGEKRSALSWLELQPVAWLYSQKVAKGSWDELPTPYFAKIAAGRQIRKEFGCKPICETALIAHLENLQPYVPSLQMVAFKRAKDNLANKGLMPTENAVNAEGKPIFDTLLAEEKERIALAKNNASEIFDFLQSDIIETKQYALQTQANEKYQSHYDTQLKSVRKTLGKWVKGAYIQLKPEIANCVFEDDLANMQAIMEKALLIFKELRMNIEAIEKEATQFNEIASSVDISKLFQ